MVARVTLAAASTSRQEIKKSRFLASAGPVADEEEARRFIAAQSDPDANHNCWAWRIGQGYRFNDDGEPSGTAGKPILAAIDGQGLDGIAVVVTRWFGGVLLGSGGLMRAYGGTAAQALRAAETVTLVETVPLAIACPFADLARLQARLAALPGVTLTGQAFTATGAVLDVAAPRAKAMAVAQLAVDLTSGRAEVTWDGPDQTGLQRR
ncbi:YigZ family protein [Bosea sp. TWI1241]|uniref:IMPACT family protein n=1 Tax=Bosea sp. TWI1241 TaxID=3148904 RepID=UPI00320944ED